LGEAPKTKEDQRRSAEKKARKDGGKVTYPSMDELRAEDLEEKPFLVFEIRDAQGDVVARYKEEKVGKGLNQSVWDFRLEATSPVQLKEGDGGRYGSPDYGPLALPGDYTVTIYQFHDGEMTKLSEPTSFKIKALHQDQISPADDAQLTQFIASVNEARKEMRAAAEEVNEMKTQVDYMREAIMKTPDADAMWISEIDAIRKDIIAIQYELWGDRSRSKREVEAYPGMISRVEEIAYNIKAHTEAPTQSEMRSLEAAQDEFKDVEGKIESIEDRVDDMAAKLKEAGAPYFKH